MNMQIISAKVLPAGTALTALVLINVDLCVREFATAYLLTSMRQHVK